MAEFAPEALQKKDWTSLAYAVEKGKCTLMLGPHAVTGVFDGRRLPVMAALAQFIKDQLGDEYAHLDPNNPSSVAQAAVASEDQYVLHGWVKEFYDQLEGEFDILADLAALPFELVVNTSPGLSADRAFRAVKPGTLSAFYDRTQPADPWFPALSPESPVVYNLYGSLDRMESLILSDIDRLDFLVSVISDEPPLPRKLTAALKDPERSFLFLGFELMQWQLRVLLHVLARNADRRYRSFAAELEGAGLDLETTAFYQVDHRISFFSMDLADFTRELRDRVEVDLEQQTTSPSEPAVAPDAPVVFLCHANEDAEIVGQVADQLRRNGIAPWLDVERLRGGDRWDRVLERVIQNDVDYVAVLQSPNLAACEVGYVNKEIGLALERQRYYRAPRKFLIPLTLHGQGDCLRELAHLQCVHLNEPGGLDDFVRTIHRDATRAVSR